MPAPPPLSDPAIVRAVPILMLVSAFVMSLGPQSWFPVGLATKGNGGNHACTYRRSVPYASTNWIRFYGLAYQPLSAATVRPGRLHPNRSPILASMRPTDKAQNKQLNKGLHKKKRFAATVILRKIFSIINQCLIFSFRQYGLYLFYTQIFAKSWV